jgi:glycosyltransferase involved in cell wall biosynthesis
MIIAIDLTPLSYHITGIERYALCITEKMLDIDKENQYFLTFRNEIYPTLKEKVKGERVQAIILNGNHKLIFFQIILPLALYKLKADRYLFFAFTSPILFRKKGIYNTIHDMGSWDAGDTLKLFQKIYLKVTCRFSADISEGIITVSNFSKKRIAEILKYPKERIRVISSAVYEGIMQDYGISFEEIQKEYDLPRKYIMTLSTLEPRKNMKILLEAFCDIEDNVNYDLVLVGRKGWKMDKVIDRYNTQRRIHITGFIKDEHISLIYKNALCFVFPSLYEGFGLPPVEALALGTPVIATDAASIPEVLMGQATYFKNNSKKELKKLLLDLEKNVASMPCELTSDQKENYNYLSSAQKVLDFISGE